MAEAEVAKKRPPLVSSTGGSTEGDKNVGLVLYVNEEKTKENSPDLNGFYIKAGKRHYVSGWLIPAGTSGEGADAKAYDAFVSLRESVPKGNGEYEVVGQGAAHGVNNWKGAPVDGSHRSVLIANLKVNGEDIVATGYATKELVDHPELATALGFNHPVVAKSDKPEAEAAAEESPAEARRPAPGR